MGIIAGLEVTAVLIAIVVALFGGYWVYLRKNNFWTGKPIPSEPPFPFLGRFSVFFTSKKIHEDDIILCKKYGRIFGSYFGMQPVVYITDPELLRLIFVKDFSSFSSRTNVNFNNKTVDNMVSLLPGGEKWKNIRNTLSPALSTGKLKKMIPLFCECVKNTVNSFTTYSVTQEPVEVKRIYGNFTLDAIANVAFGTNLNSQNDPNNQFVTHANMFFASEFSWTAIISFLFPKIGKLFGIEFFPSEAIDFFAELTRTIVKRREMTQEVRPDFLQMMMESMRAPEEESDKENMETKENELNDNDSFETELPSVEKIKRKPLTENEFLAQCIQFFIAGYESTSSTLATVSYYLALNPLCQKNAQLEVDKIWKNRDVIDSDAINEAKYLGAVVYEAMRLLPVSSAINRICNKDYKLEDRGITIPSGMIVNIPLYAMHHDPEFFPDPEKFDPERFLDENNNVHNSYTYFPFGAGPRNCIAMRLALMEIKLCLLYVLRDIEFWPSEKTEVPLQFKLGPVLQPKNVFLLCKRRSTTANS